MTSAAERLAYINELANKFHQPAQQPANTDREATAREVADAVREDAKAAPEPPANPTVQAALRCVELGWFVFALEERGKRPDGELAPHGFNSSTNDPDVVRSWWAKKPNANYGIDLGRSNLTVLDFDHGAPAGLCSELPNTLQVSTSRGVHVYFQGVSKQGDLHLTGQHVGEIKSAGGYVLGPGCVHPDGPIYTVVHRAPVAPIPSGLIEHLRPAKGKEETVRNERGLIPHGQIHPWMLKQAGRLRNDGLTQEEIEPILLRLVHENCEPPIDDAKVEQMAKSICIYPPGEGDTSVKVGARGAAVQQTQTASVDVSNWQSLFRSIGEMEDGPIDMIIEGALQEGTCFLGANPGEGKTLVALAFAKAICTGTPLFGLPQFAVSKPRPVIYLIPESRDRAFRKRCEAFRLPDDKTKFMARTISAGAPLDLADPLLLEAVRQTRGVVFLDTASRFMKSNDENAAAQNRFLVNDVIALLAAGAVCVVIVHHATKAAKQEDMTLENMLRGTSDLGAMCDQAYGIKKDTKKYANGSGPMEITLANLKDREQIATNGLSTLRLAASWKEEKRAEGGVYQVTFPVSYIDTTGNFRVVSETEAANNELFRLEALVQSNPEMSAKQLAEALTQTSEYRVLSQLKKLGWYREQGGADGATPWHQHHGGVCPYKQAEPVEITLPDAVKKLTAFLEDTRLESDVYQWADKEGISDGLLAKAAKRLGVVKGKQGKDKTWAPPVSKVAAF